MFGSIRLQRCLALTFAVFCGVVFLVEVVNFKRPSPASLHDASVLLDSWLNNARRKIALTLGSIRRNDNCSITTPANPESTNASDTQANTSAPTINSSAAPSTPKPRPPLYPEGFQLCDLEDFTYVINNDVCGNAKVDIIMLVVSDSRSAEHRSILRSALPQQTLEELRMRRVFLLAQQPTPNNRGEYHRRVAAQHAENHFFKDLVSGDFIDSYRNLSYKHLMGFHWATTYCPQAIYIWKMDHDFAIDPFRMRQKLMTAPRTMTAIGMVMGETYPIRNPKNKWFVSKEEYPKRRYPNYMSGGTYAITPDAAGALVAGARNEKLFWVDDVFVTGVIRSKHVPKLRLKDITAMWGQRDKTGKKAK